MNRIRCDTGAFETPGEFVREHDIRELALVIGGRGLVGLLAAKAFEVERALGVQHRSEMDDSRRRACFELLEQQVREQEGTEVVDTEL